MPSALKFKFALIKNIKLTTNYIGGFLFNFKKWLSLEEYKIDECILREFCLYPKKFLKFKLYESLGDFRF